MCHIMLKGRANRLSLLQSYLIHNRLDDPRFSARSRGNETAISGDTGRCHRDERSEKLKSERIMHRKGAWLASL
jgi:hypothetical protein